MSHAPKQIIRDEIKLILACVRVKYDVRAKKEIEGRLRGNIDWQFLINAADQHRVLPLLCNRLVKNFAHAIPPDMVAYLRRWYHYNTIRNKMLARELVNLLKMLADADISCIPFKGPVSAAMIYNDISLRQFNDLDILVDKKDYLRIQKYLEQLGYKKTSDWGYEVGFKHESSMINIDVHQDFDKHRLSSGFNFKTLSKRLKPIDLSGGRITGLSAEDTLINLCINFAKDLFINKTKLSQISDIANHIDLHPAMNWPWIFDNARRHGIKRILLLCISLSNRLLGTTMPEEIRQHIGHPRLESLMTEIGERLLDLLCGKRQFYERDEGRFIKQKMYLKLKERVRDRIPEYCQMVKYCLVHCRNDIRHLFQRQWKTV